MKIILTGTPGVGKTTIGKLFAEKHGLKYININKIAFDNNLVNEDGEITDMKKLEYLLKKEENCVIEGHLACEMKLGEEIVVLRCDPLILKERLKKRKYNKKKLLDNLESECLDYCEILGLENYKKVHQIDCTNKKIDEIIKILEKIYSGKTIFYEKVDFSNCIFELF